MTNMSGVARSSLRVSPRAGDPIAPNRFGETLDPSCCPRRRAQ
jgi:hypothetical protein